MMPPSRRTLAKHFCAKESWKRRRLLWRRPLVWIQTVRIQESIVPVRWSLLLTQSSRKLRSARKATWRKQAKAVIAPDGQALEPEHPALIFLNLEVTN